MPFQHRPRLFCEEPVTILGLLLRIPDYRFDDYLFVPLDACTGFDKRGGKRSKEIVVDFESLIFGLK